MGVHHKITSRSKTGPSLQTRRGPSLVSMEQPMHAPKPQPMRSSKLYWPEVAAVFSTARNMGPGPQV